MLIKYNVWDEDAEEVIPEIATFSGITYDKEDGLCYLILVGDDFDDVIFQMFYLTPARRPLPYLDMGGNELQQ